MKANEALEKIYIHEASVHELTEKLPYHIEYIRKDAFIEKARKWFELQNEWRDINGIKHCDMDSFEDFKKYMEE